MLQAVEAFIDDLPPEQRDIAWHLHRILVDDYDLGPKLRYGIPFYDHQTWICYINPVKKPQGMELVFLRGADMEDPFGLLQTKGRKMVAGITLTEITDLPDEALAFYLDQALELAKTKRKTA